MGESVVAVGPPVDHDPLMSANDFFHKLAKRLGYNNLMLQWGDNLGGIRFEMNLADPEERTFVRAACRFHDRVTAGGTLTYLTNVRVGGRSVDLPMPTEARRCVDSFQELCKAAYIGEPGGELPSVASFEITTS